MFGQKTKPTAARPVGVYKNSYAGLSATIRSLVQTVYFFAEAECAPTITVTTLTIQDTPANAISELLKVMSGRVSVNERFMHADCKGTSYWVAPRGWRLANSSPTCVRV